MKIFVLCVSVLALCVIISDTPIIFLDLCTAAIMAWAILEINQSASHKKFLRAAVIVERNRGRCFAKWNNDARQWCLYTTDQHLSVPHSFGDTAEEAYINHASYIEDNADAN